LPENPRKYPSNITHISNPKNLKKVFCKTLGNGFSPKITKGFAENLYGFFTLCV
jgi:hypothetical protein